MPAFNPICLAGAKQIGFSEVFVRFGKLMAQLIAIGRKTKESGENQQADQAAILNKFRRLLARGPSGACTCVVFVQP